MKDPEVETGVDLEERLKNNAHWHVLTRASVQERRLDLAHRTRARPLLGSVMV